MKIFIVLLVLFCSKVFASLECQSVIINDAQQEHAVSASIIKGLHIRFYEDIKLSLVSNDALWKSVTDDDFPQDFWLFPKNIINSDKNSVGVTFILKDKTSVHLVVTMDINASSCLVVSSQYNKESLHKFSQPFKISKSPNLDNELIASSYNYDTSFVKSVYDDGIFTYVKINDNIANAFSVASIVEDELSVISNLKYMRRTNTYRVAGIHQKLKFTDGSTVFFVELK